MQDPIVDQAMEIWSKLSNDPKVREEYFAREKAVLDEKAAIREAELRVRKAMEEGIVKGRKDANLETAKKMLGRGMDIPTISEIVGISEEEIEKLR